ncbi:MAG: bifunctional folylpolyglutamate synthase/dihydrofolate synthase [Chloroflexota bacterium]|nr:bifunctional folylpolyglutamate synthase/dihydrofolate synthase [Chloroflexota bacterium]
MPRTYQQALEYLYSFTDMERTPGQPTGAGLGLARVHAFLDRIGRPERAYRTILVAGTKGKGSTANYLAGALRAAGYRTGLYTQPHLTAFRERLQVDGALIAEDRLGQLVEWVQPYVAAQHAAPTDGLLTTYEVATALALQYFHEEGVDYAVLEIGLGGRLDAVNAVQTPVLSVITSLSLDHTRVLGDTLAQIAGEKAGIIKPGTPVVSAPQPPTAAPVIAATAAERDAPLYVVGTDLTITATDNPDSATTPPGHVRRRSQRVTLTPGPRLAALAPTSLNGPAQLDLPLLGAHQAVNAAVAYAGCRLLAAGGADRLTPAAITAGFGAVQWPGRLEIVQEAPLLILDGAHNDASAVALAATLPAEFRYRRLLLVLGLMADKDAAAILHPLLPLADAVIFTQSGHPRAATAEAVREAAGAAQAPPAPERWTTAATVAAALAQAQAAVGPQDAILVTGSLSVVGEARAALGLGPPPDPVGGDFFYRMDRSSPPSPPKEPAR